MCKGSSSKELSDILSSSILPLFVALDAFDNYSLRFDQRRQLEVAVAHRQPVVVGGILVSRNKSL